MARTRVEGACFRPLYVQLRPILFSAKLDNIPDSRNSLKPVKFIFFCFLACFFRFLCCISVF